MPGLAPLSLGGMGSSCPSQAGRCTLGEGRSECQFLLRQASALPRFAQDPPEDLFSFAGCCAEATPLLHTQPHNARIQTIVPETIVQISGLQRSTL